MGHTPTMTCTMSCRGSWFVSASLSIVSVGADEQVFVGKPLVCLIASAKQAFADCVTPVYTPLATGCRVFVLKKV